MSIRANLADSLGRKPCLVLGCLCSGFARILWAREPTSSQRFVLYRMINVIANIPITQATSVMLIDYCGGRTTNKYSVMNRRMWIMLAAMRVLTTAFSSWVNRHRSNPDIKDENRNEKAISRAASELKWAGYMSLLAGLFFLCFSRETLSVKNPKALFRNPFQVWKESFLFFLQTPERRKIAPFLLLRSFPAYSMTLHLQLNKLTGFVGEKRAKLSMFENVMDVFVPLVLNEMLHLSFESMQLSMRVSTLCDLLRLTVPSSRYFNAVADRLVSSGQDYHALLKKAQGGYSGEASLEAAVDSLCFPLSILLPRLYYFLSSKVGVLRTFWLIVLVGVVNSELYYPKVIRPLMAS